MRHLQKPWYPQSESQFCLDTYVSIKVCMHWALSRSSGQKKRKGPNKKLSLTGIVIPGNICKTLFWFVSE